MNKNTIEFKKLKTFLTTPIKNGYSPVCTDVETSKTILSLGALTGQSIDLSKIKWVPETNKKTDNFLINPGDFLVSRSNTLDKVGRAALYRGGLDNCAYPDLIMKFRIDEATILPDFLEVLLQSSLARKHFMQRASGTSSSMVKITKSAVESLPIPLLPLQTQKKIAEIAASWKKTIKKTDALIVAKEKQFEWLIHQLINPSNKHWNLRRLSSISKIKKGQQLNRILLTKTDLFPAWNGGITPSGHTDTWNTPAGTVTISEGGNSCGFVNYCKEKFWCGGHCYALLDISHEIDPAFLFYFLKAHEKQIMSLRVGSGLPNIQRRDIEKLEIAYPQLSEQRKIVQILSEAQKEISILKLLTDKYIHQKRGLMQKLLTGTWQILKLQEEVA
ncbi:putative type-I restriction enzyme specificity protein [Legionella santicrucis]|uniref:Putative type-I restriction enzyme specificity protein n=2 Tax=Legionella santicrucis TaxID=45074 RepID=A0A0W0Z176_9GAMM|nr:restriction endonuclease subunit S [Legionella santicrucis]KTD62654.1 putative type-I restriction enzyme specificity protein [Legionella santicrucis]